MATPRHESARSIGSTSICGVATQSQCKTSCSCRTKLALARAKATSEQSQLAFQVSSSPSSARFAVGFLRPLSKEEDKRTSKSCAVRRHDTGLHTQTQPANCNQHSTAQHSTVLHDISTMQYNFHNTTRPSLQKQAILDGLRALTT